MRCLITALVLMLSFGLAAGARADEIEGDDARGVFHEGTALFEAGRFIEAADAFRAAYRLKPNWKILYNIGQCEAAAKRYGLALELFETYLAQGGDDVPEDRREEVLAEVIRLRSMVGFLKIEAPANATAIVDGVERGMTPMSMEIPIGVGLQHEVTIAIEGRSAPPQTVKVIGGKTATLTFEAPPLPPPPLEPPLEEEEEEEVETAAEESTEQPVPVADTSDESSPLKTWGWITVGVGGALLAGGAVTGVLALKANDTINDKCPDGCYSQQYEELDRRKKLALTTDVLLPAGGAVAATGIVLLIVAVVRDGEEDAGVTVAPSIDAESARLAVEWRF